MVIRPRIGQVFAKGLPSVYQELLLKDEGKNSEEEGAEKVAYEEWNRY